MTMHPSVARAIQEIDAAFFSGDTFENPKARRELEKYLARWNRAIQQLAPIRCPNCGNEGADKIGPVTQPTYVSGTKRVSGRVIITGKRLCLKCKHVWKT